MEARRVNEETKFYLILWCLIGTENKAAAQRMLKFYLILRCLIGTNKLVYCFRFLNSTLFFGA